MHKRLGEEDKVIGFKPGAGDFATKEREPEILIYKTGNAQCRSILAAYRAQVLIASGLELRTSA